MGVYIKGITIPKGCYDCPMLEGDRYDGLCHAASKWLDDDEYWLWYAYPEGDIDDSKPTNCPLLPVPGHGDLIDRGNLIEKAVFVGDAFTGVGGYAVWGEDVLHTPAVIPAERSDNGET